MGNILLPSPGDLVDRQTILEVKLEHCGVEDPSSPHAPSSVDLMEQSTEKSVSRKVLLEKTEIDIQPTLIEHEAIQEKLEREWFPKLTAEQGEKFDMLHKTLKNTNSELWKLEDKARVLRHAPERFSSTVLARKAETLDAITTCNDARIRFVNDISALWDIQAQEKLYA